MQTPTRSVKIDKNKRKEPCIEDLDALLNDNDNEEINIENQMDQQQTNVTCFLKRNHKFIYFIIYRMSLFFVMYIYNCVLIKLEN